MKRVCAWCGKDLGDVDGPEGEISHGACGECADQIMAGRPQSLQDFIERIEAPILALDENFQLIAANAAARSAFGKNLPPRVGQFCGDVLECVNAGLPGGCGQTVHCLACAIRHAVEETHATGKPNFDAPAYVDRIETGGRRRKPLAVSTEKVRGAILLRIDESE